MLGKLVEGMEIGDEVGDDDEEYGGSGDGSAEDENYLTENDHNDQVEQLETSVQDGLAYLPPEIVDHVLRYIEDPFPVDLLFVCKTWYHVGLKYIYNTPDLKVSNYSKFVEVISGSDYLGTLVRVLDLRNIIQSGKNSYTSRLLRRCSSGLETFIAPQTSFGYAPLISLRQCTSIRTLDLGLVSETIDLRELFQAIKGANLLERLEFPRSSVFCAEYDFEWPQKLNYLGLAGGISNEFINVTRFPSTITRLSLSHCPFVTTISLRSLIARLGDHLTSLAVMYPLPALRPNTLDSVLRLCPKLRSLTVSVDYISRHVFELPNLPADKRGVPQAHPLRYLTLDSSGLLGQAHKIDAGDITLAILDDKIPNMVNVRISQRMGWNPADEEITELVEVLELKEGGVYIY